jgi:pimeloyl-ACP methyl ester carboxylesterase
MTRDLVKDTEKLREHLKIEKWHVFGGSWVCFHLRSAVVLLRLGTGIDAITRICAGSS